MVQLVISRVHQIWIKMVDYDTILLLYPTCERYFVKGYCSELTQLILNQVKAGKICLRNGVTVKSIS